MPTALPRSSGGKIVVITDSVTGITNAAPTPITTRSPISASGVLTNIAASDASPNSASPTARIGLRPKRSPIAPAGQQQRRERERVRVDDPLELRLRRARVARRCSGSATLRLATDGDDHHQRQAHDAQHRPRRFLSLSKVILLCIIVPSFLKFNAC